jgi:hypothetical protein
MEIVQVSDGIIFIPRSNIQILCLIFLSVFCGKYEETLNKAAYPKNRRFKLYKQISGYYE